MVGFAIMARFCNWKVDALSALELLSRTSEPFQKWARLVNEYNTFKTSYPGSLEIRFREGLFEAVCDEQVCLRIDLLNDRKNYFRKNLKGKKDLLLRALGIGQVGQAVIDLTCGLGRDTIFLAQQGMKIVSFERDPLIAFLFESSLVLQKPFSKDNIQFHWANTMNKNFEFPPAETAYFDPMYPLSRRMTARPKKEIEFLRNHLGSPENMKNEEDFVAHLIEKKIFRRITVKVHPQGQFNPGVLPHHVYRGEAVSYHSYLTRS